MTSTEVEPDPSMKEELLNNVEQTATQYSGLKGTTREVRDKLDAEILAAQQLGATYRELATKAGVSTAWIQSSLARSGYVPNSQR